MPKQKKEGPKKYELLLILDPLRTEEQQKESLDKLEETITKYGGKIDRREVIGKRRLAFPIQKRRDGYYAAVYFDAETRANTLDEVDRYCRYAEDILRSLRTVAVVGKTVGNTTLATESFTRPYGRFGSRGDRPDRGGDRSDRMGPVSAPAAAPAEPAAEAPSA